MVMARRLDIYALKVMGEVPRETLSVSKVVNFYINRKIRSTGITRDPALSAQFRRQIDRSLNYNDIQISEKKIQLQRVRKSRDNLNTLRESADVVVGTDTSR